MIACIQMKLSADDYRTQETFEDKIFDLMKRTRQQAGKGQLLVVFPEHIGTFCLLCNESAEVWSSGSFSKAVSKIIKAHFLSISGYRLFRRQSWIRSLALVKSGEAERIYLSTFSKAAREFGAWIVAGSGMTRWGQTNTVYNSSPVFNPFGELVHRQHKVHLVDMEGPEGLDIAPAPVNYLSAVESPFGRLGIAICLDAFKEDVWNRLQDLDVKILIQPSANNGPWNEWQKEDWLNSSYKAVYSQKRFPLAINPMLVGGMWELEFEGQSSIISTSGYVSRAQTHNEEEILVSSLV
ncbi:MAG: carbon-nitrogen hydrolase family protein [Firmicutes bacterium]|jgi:predicted amidohydrolase|nr:carbon-nitrogen hydrolase family protein [Bacillota bacterium]